jgi:hypothetical protein
MTRAPVPDQRAALCADPAVNALGGAVHVAKGSDPLAPVTVVAPSAYAALYARRALGAVDGPGGRRGVANVNCTTVDKLIRQLGMPVLSARGQRLAPPHVDLEAIRTTALASRRWLADLVGHPRGLAAIRAAVGELRRCPLPTLVALRGRRDRVADLCRLSEDVRAHLHGRGFADTVDLAEAAQTTAQRGALETLGPVLVLDPGALAPFERSVLDAVVARTGTTPVGTTPVGTGTSGGGPALTEVRACADPDEEVRAAVRDVVAAVDAGVPACTRSSPPPVSAPTGPRHDTCTGRWRGRHCSASSSWRRRIGRATRSWPGSRRRRSCRARTVAGCRRAGGTRCRRRRAWCAGARSGPSA